MLARARLLPLLLLAFLAVGCGSNSEDDSGSSSSSVVSADDSGADAQPHRLLDDSSTSDDMGTALSASVTCDPAHPDSCSPSVGMLVMTLPNSGVAECSAFLVAPNIALTNSHCIPDDLKAANSPCTDRIWMNFPDVPGTAGERVDCEKVLTASTISAVGGMVQKILPDYAVLQLSKPLQRPVLEISRDGFADQENVRLVKIDPQSQTEPVGEMTSTLCRAVHGSLVVPDSDSPLSANMAMGDCTVIHGNSGSPILGADGKVRGVIQFTVDKSAMELRLRTGRIFLFDPTQAAIGGGTNFACLNFPAAVPAPAIPAACANPQDTATDDRKARDASLAAGLQQKIQAAAASGQLDPAFEWSFTTETTGSGFLGIATSPKNTLVPTPACVKDQAGLLAAHKGWISGYAASAELSLSLPTFGVQLGIDRYYVSQIQIHPTGALEDDHLSFSPDALASTGKTAVTLTRPAGLLSSGATIFSGTIGLCAN